VFLLPVHNLTFVLVVGFVNTRSVPCLWPRQLAAESTAPGLSRDLMRVNSGKGMRNEDNVSWWMCSGKQNLRTLER
jgi:hypothetical protein